MFRSRRSFSSLMPFVVALFVILLAGCAAKRVLVETPETGVTLQYKMPEGRTLKYDLSQEFIQGFEVQGTQNEVKAYTTYAFSVESNGQKEGNHQLTFTIDDMKVDVVSPQGDIAGNTESVIGKSFDMLLSPIGEEIEIGGLGGIKYELGPAGKRGIASNFEALFPDLSKRPVKAGDSWTSIDTVNIRETDTSIQLTFENTNTVEGFEMVEGYECARIASDVKGALNGTGKEAQAELVMSGEVKGKDTWYFAYKEGIYVKMESEAYIEGTITVAGAEAMVIPMNNIMSNKLTLVK